MDAPPGSAVSSFASGIYGGLIRALRGITNHTVNQEPKWRNPKHELVTGYDPKYYGNGHHNGNHH
jgi:hydrogenase small subunit